jgi:hypothetical protein
MPKNKKHPVKVKLVNGILLRWCYTCEEWKEDFLYKCKQHAET